MVKRGKKMKFLKYDLQFAAEDPTTESHPQAQMRKMFNVIHCVPQSIADCWWFCVEDYDENLKLPKYLVEIPPYNLSYWRDHCFQTCEAWQEAFKKGFKDKGETKVCHGSYGCPCGKY